MRRAGRVAIELLILLTCLLWMLGNLPVAMPQTQPLPKPRIKVTCVMSNHPYDLAHYNKDDPAHPYSIEEHDDWRVHCTVVFKGEMVFDNELSIPRPTGFREASAEVDEFRTKKAQKLVQDWEATKKAQKSSKQP